ncbi:metallophosphoesterase family protein [Streptomyces pathocidini]|uniref:Metallophosphoesterase family protein n=1 Tax=Streptomyces pathocidini TaxID=1650571 RepID=A0ABW7V399_9ACTN|nr:metallophosphoesterase [Streptomyces pathocidini]
MNDEELVFRFGIISDTQFPRALESGSGTETAYGNQSQSEENNNNLAKALRGDSELELVMLNGDLTEFGHGSAFSSYDELGAYRRTYEGKLNRPLYFGLGNHDYANNIGNSFQNNCAIGMIKYMEGQQSIWTPENYSTDFHVKHFPATTFTLGYEKRSGSYAYSFDYKGVHFVQLNNYPFYKVDEFGDDWNSYWRIDPSYPGWLESDLWQNRGKPIILNLHDPSEHWGPGSGQVPEDKRLLDKFFALLRSTGVGAVFSGHYHADLGRQVYWNHWGLNAAEIPIFSSGSPIYNHFLKGGVTRRSDGSFFLAVSQCGSEGGNDRTIKAEDPVRLPHESRGMSLSISESGQICGQPRDSHNPDQSFANGLPQWDGCFRICSSYHLFALSVENGNLSARSPDRQDTAQDISILPANDGSVSLVFGHNVESLVALAMDDAGEVTVKALDSESHEQKFEIISQQEDGSFGIRRIWS